jgi:hypothetical protein
MTKKLTIKESVLVMGILPQEHNYLTLLEIEELRNELIFSEEENRKFDIESKQTPDGRYYLTFNEESTEGYLKDIKMGARAASAVTQALKDMDRNNKLTFAHTGLYEKFVIGKKNGNTGK